MPNGLITGRLQIILFSVGPALSVMAGSDYAAFYKHGKHLHKQKRTITTTKNNSRNKRAAGAVVFPKFKLVNQ